MGQYTLFKLFGTLTCPHKIRVSYLSTQKTHPTKPIALECCGQLAIYGCPELVLCFNYYYHFSSLVLWNGSGTTSFLHGREGVKKEDPLDMVTYSIGVIPLIKQLKASYL